MPASPEQFLERCLLVDIEINEHRIIYSIGALFGEQTFRSPAGKAVGHQTLQALNSFGQAADFVVGHNIISHDMVLLKELAPALEMLGKKTIDTLYLSPLAYPANPYHRLVKDYQLVRDSVSDPVADARLAGRVFSEQWQAFAGQLKSGSEVLPLYRGFLEKEQTLTGTAEALAAMGIPHLKGDDLYRSFAHFAGKYACITAVDQLLDRLYESSFDYPVLAYIVAWLSVAGGNSVLPPWVRHHFPQISSLLHTLRENPCADPDCGYCRQHHDPHHYLRTFFGFDDFRSEPACEDGQSLQQKVTDYAAKNGTLFATLPTGGGKSLCYLLPGLMRYQRRNMLTIVISPLQALMKDQVDNFTALTGTSIAVALYGMLTMPERSEVLESIRLGNAGLLYVSPEQLRNFSFLKTIGQREIGAWVFDEAHCLSKWGHDFRPDYLYAIRFIRELAAREKSPVPPVQCFTATAKKDVKSEIIDIIQSELGLRVEQFEGGHERQNLHYQVFAVDKYEKYQLILELLRERYDGQGSVVIYCASRKNSEKLAEFLANNGYTADAFHAGLDVSLKKRVQENFIDGDLPIICATNAFGMGIDKDDVRLVIHADIPGSLENYLQEAGRAGRDRQDADCILIFDEQDIEGQFRLSSGSRLSRREIAQMLRGIRTAARGGEEVVLTTGELLRQEQVDIDIDDLQNPDTSVRTAIAWLERSGFLERNENSTRVFQGKPLVRDLEEAAEKIGKLNLSARQQERWMAILTALMENGPRQGFSADELAGLSSFATNEGDKDDQTESQRVLITLQDMAEQGILSKETTLTAYLRYKVANNGPRHLQRLCLLEKDFLTILEELAPDAELEIPLELDLRQLNQRLVDQGHDYSNLRVLRGLLYGLGRDGRGLAGQSGSVSLRARGNNRFTVYLHRDWQALKKTVELRQQAATITLGVIIGTIAPGTQPNGDLLVEFTLEQIVAGLRADLLLLPVLKNPLAAAERALTFMNEQGVLDLQHGLAVFHQSMTLRLHPEAKGRRYAASDFSPLKTHYSERNFQIHVMNEYARHALLKLSSAMRLVSSYFNDEKDDFVNRYFPGRKQMLERATSQQSYQRIVDDLKNDSQSAIVAAATEKNMLILAGPGAGKTRVIVHRVAFLLRVKRVNPSAILVLCFNRSAVLSLRRRLRELVGIEMARVTTLTFHGLALRLTGNSLATAAKDGSREVDFPGVIDRAISFLEGQADLLGFEGESPREELIGRYSHILLDEYQDIDDRQYQLVSLLAGRSLKDHDRRMTIVAVGDDDQNIYRFRGANIKFINKFRNDYQAEIYYLIENYRSTGHIIAAANMVIAENLDRMKAGHPVVVNLGRKILPAGGNFAASDPLARGKVQILRVESAFAQSAAILGEMRRLQALEGGFEFDNCAILARQWNDLDSIRSLFESEGLRVNLHWGRGGSFAALWRIRENAVLLDFLRSRRSETIRGSSLLEFLANSWPQEKAKSIWQENIIDLLNQWAEETHDADQPVSAIEEYLYEALADQGRSRNLGKGVFLSTIHSVKGLEFDHVFILGESWKNLAKEEVEEERRLYYVAMSRARQTLQLMAINAVPNLHIAVLSGDAVLSRSLPAVQQSPAGGRRYTLLGMEDLFIDFAAYKAEDHPVRSALADLGAGDALSIELRNEHLELIDKKGLSLARLSQSAKNVWLRRLEEIEAVRVVAMVRRYPEDISDESYRRRCSGTSWEVPLVELVHR
jgi:ATP-dependent DNA helicase RecQ